MEIVIILAAIFVVAAIWYYNKGSGLDVNKDGKVDIKDAESAIKATVKGLETQTKVVKEKAKATAKKTTAKVKEAVKKPRGRKPKAK